MSDACSPLTSMSINKTELKETENQLSNQPEGVSVRNPSPYVEIFSAENTHYIFSSMQIDLFNILEVFLKDRWSG